MAQTEQLNLQQRRGMIKFSNVFFTDIDDKVMKAIFSNFFPIDIQVNHGYNFNDSKSYYGFSPHFRILTEGEMIPYQHLVACNQA